VKPYRYSRRHMSDFGRLLRHLVLVVVCQLVFQTVSAQPVRLVNSYTPSNEEDKRVLAAIAGLQLDDDGSLLVVDGKKGVFQHIKANKPSSLVLGGEGRIFKNGKLSGISRVSSNYYVVLNSGQASMAIIDGSGKTIRHISRSGRDSGLLKRPASLAYSANKRIYVADRGNKRISVFNLDGIFITTIGDKATDKTRLKNPRHVAVDALERVYVLEEDNAGRLSIYSNMGELIAQIQASELKKQLGQMPKLSALAVDKNGIVYLGDNGGGKVIKYDWENRNIIQSLGSRGPGRGQFYDISELSVDSRGNLAVADSDNEKIEVYAFGNEALSNSNAPAIKLQNVAVHSVIPALCKSAYPLPSGGALCVPLKGKGLQRISKKGHLSGFISLDKQPQALTIADGMIALLAGNKVHVYDLEANSLFSVGTYGYNEGAFNAPSDIKIHQKKIYVSDTRNSRVQIFSEDGIFIGKIQGNEKQGIKLGHTGSIAIDSNDNVFIVDNDARLIRVFSPDKKQLYTLGEADKSAQRYRKIFALDIDADDNLFVLSRTKSNAQLIQVFNDGKQIFSFGSKRSDSLGFKKATSLAVGVVADSVVSVFDKEQTQIKSFRFLQVPGAVTGLNIAGSVSQVSFEWLKSVNDFVTQYRVFAAHSESGPYQLVETVAGHETTIGIDILNGYEWFKVSALTNFGMEGYASEPRQNFFQKGYRLYQEEKYADAVEAFNEAYKLDAKKADLLEYTGRSLYALGQHQNAMRYYRELAALPDKELLGLKLQVESLFELKEFIEARGLLEKVIAGKPTDIGAYILCAELSHKLGDAVGAVSCAEDALKVDSENVTARFLLGESYIKVGIPDQGIDEFNKAVAIEPKNTDLLLRVGDALMSLKMHQKALLRYKKILEIDAVDQRAKLGVARALVAMKKYDEAKTIAISLAGKEGSEADGNYLLGVIELAKGNTKIAMLRLTKASRQAPDNVRVWLALADTFMKLGQKSRVLESLGKAHSADPSSFNAVYRLGKAQLAKGDSVGAIESLSKAIVLQSSHAKAQKLLARSLYKQRHYKKSLVHAKLAGKIDPKDVESLVLMADASSASGSTGDAIDFLKSAIAIDGTSPELELKLGKVYLDNNFYDDAKQHLERAAILNTKTADPHVALGQMYITRRLFDKAIAALDKAVKLAPTVTHKALLNTAYAEKKKSLDFKQNAPQLVLQELHLNKVFSAAYKQYAKEPIGRVVVQNVAGTDFGNLKLSFSIKGYMDYPTAQEIPLLKANSQQAFDLNATFNNQILEVDEDTGVQVEVKLSYIRDGRQDAVTLTQPMTIYGKNAIVWAKAKMVGSFVTPRDDTLRDFVRQVINQYKPDDGPLNRNLISAMTYFSALSAMGTKYQIDPNTPFNTLREDQVDYVQFPRETLRLKSGDCDDLSVLMSAGLENLGVDTALLDVPGHLLMMFNTGLDEAQSDQISLQKDLLVIREGKVWLPIEATMVAQTFAEAWAEGARKYYEAESRGQLKVIQLKDAWSGFRPVTLAKASYSIPVPTKEHVEPIVSREHALLMTKGLDRLVLPYKAMVESDPSNSVARMQIAITYAKYGLTELAKTEFDALLAIDAKNSAVYINLGNLYLGTSKYSLALESYESAEQLDSVDGGIKLNMSMALYKLGKLNEARKKFKQAVSLDRAIANSHSAFGKLLSS